MAAAPGIVDAWAQQPTDRFMAEPWLASLLRWTGQERRTPSLDELLAAMDAAGVELALLSAWHGPGGALISNDEVAGFVAAAPDRLRGVASVDLQDPMGAVREIRRCVGELGFVAVRALPWLWGLPPDDRRFYPVYVACVEHGVPFGTQVGHTGPLRPSEPGRPIPYLDNVLLDFPELVLVAGHVGVPGSTRWSRWPTSTRTCTSTRRRTRSRASRPRSRRGCAGAAGRGSCSGRTGPCWPPRGAWRASTAWASTTRRGSSSSAATPGGSSRSERGSAGRSRDR